jgi:hypothetical protein
MVEQRLVQREHRQERRQTTRKKKRGEGVRVRGEEKNRTEEGKEVVVVTVDRKRKTAARTG